MPNLRSGLAATAAIFMSACLSACSPPSPLSSDLDLVGMDPFWAVQISKDAKTAKFTRPGSSEIIVEYPVESKGEDGAIVLTSHSPEGFIVMTLRKAKCMDGMSEREYPWEAEVVFKEQTFKGCAGPRQPAG
jgi:uncharacterized membrane protein